VGFHSAVKEGESGVLGLTRGSTERIMRVALKN